MSSKFHNAAVILEDGTIYRGHGFGSPGAVFGEIVFNTAMTGYQEVVTDPSYHGQMVTFTYPLIGNYGVNMPASESDEVHSRAIIVREVHNLDRNCTAEHGWVDWLSEQGVTGISGIDTRALTRRIRNAGAMRAAVVFGEFSEAEIRSTSGRHPFDGRARPGHQGDLRRSLRARIPQGQVPRWWPSTMASSARSSNGWARPGCNVIVVPANTPAQEILAMKPDGVFLSNGPGDPAPLEYAYTLRVETAGQGAGLRHLPRPPDPQPGAGPEDLQTQIRPPGREPSGEEPRSRPRGDHFAESRFCRGAAAGAG